jgi:outer membrane protein assembly factor BamA
MKYNFFLFFISLILTFSCEDAERVLAQGDLRTVESVDIQGNRIYSDKLLFKFIKTKPGQKLTREAADDLMTLQSLGIFDKRNVELIIEPTSKNKVAVIFQVLELPIIKKVKIDGLKYLMKE